MSQTTAAWEQFFREKARKETTSFRSRPRMRGAPPTRGGPGSPAPDAGSDAAPGGSRGPAGDGLSPAARMPMTSGGFSAHPHFRLTRL